MRFLVLTTAREAGPVEMFQQLLGAMREWVSDQRSSGRIIVDFGLAGRPGGGAVVEVSSHEELDEMMAGFPFGQTSDIEIHALSDLDTALDHAERAFQRMAEAAGV